jgi:hypothetical protein
MGYIRVEMLVASECKSSPRKQKGTRSQLSRLGLSWVRLGERRGGRFVACGCGYGLGAHDPRLYSFCTSDPPPLLHISQPCRESLIDHAVHTVTNLNWSDKYYQYNAARWCLFFGLRDWSLAPNRRRGRVRIHEFV